LAALRSRWCFGVRDKELKMKKRCLLSLFSLLVTFMACGLEKSEKDSQEKPIIPVISQPLPALAFEETPLQKIPSYCERNDSLQISADIEELIRNPNPAPKFKIRRAYQCVSTIYVTAFLDYGSEDAAKHAVYRLAGRVFQGDAPLPNLRYNEVLRRGSVVAIVAGEGVAATQLAFELYRQKSFEPALAGRTLLNQYFEASRQSSMLSTLLTPSGQAALDSAMFFGTDLKCDAGGDSLFCEAIKQYDTSSTLPDLPRGGDPRVLWGPCMDVTGSQPREDVCWLLWSPLGVSLGLASEIEKTAPIDDATRRKIRESVAQGFNLVLPAASNEAVLDLGPGAPVVLKGLTHMASVRDNLILHMRGTPERVIVLGTEPNTTNRRLIGLFSFKNSK
jgi:hypothetical protein